MNTALVKIDVAAADLGVSVRRIEQMVEGEDFRMGTLVWVFDFARTIGGSARLAPRFWRPELLAVAGGDGASRRKYIGYQLDWVIDKILPVNRTRFHAGEVDQLFQIRHNTRSGYAELNGKLSDRRNVYMRATLVEFLKRRWLGAVYQRGMKVEGRMQNEEAGRQRSQPTPWPSEEGKTGQRPEIGLAETRTVAMEPGVSIPKFSSPYAAAETKADNNKHISASRTGSNAAIDLP